MSEIQDLTQAVTELLNFQREHGDEPANQTGKVEAEFEARVAELVEQQVAEKLASPPEVVGMPGDVHGPDGGISKANRYARMVKDFEQRGVYKSAGIAYRPVDLWLAQRMMQTQFDHYHPTNPGPRAEPSDDLKAAVKALTSTGDGSGDQLVPTVMAGQLWDDFFLASRIVPLMMRIAPTSNPFDIPLGLGDPTWYKGSENTATTASDPTTAKSTLTATELLTEQNWSYTLEEDAIIAMAPALRAAIVRSGAEKMDAFALNADSTNAATGNINEDDADPGDTDYFLSAGQDGIRHQWIVDNTDQAIDAGGDALDDTNIVNMLVAMGKYAVNPQDTVMVCDASTYFKGLQSLDGVQTLDKYGSQAVLLTGELARYRGIPIIVSASAPLTESDGKASTTSTNNTLGQISCFNRNLWYVGFWRDLLIEMDRNIQKRQYLMVTSFREGVAAHGTRSSNTHTAGIYNILV